MDLATRVTEALEDHPAIREIRLVGSRQSGTAGDLSDWDFQVDATDFAAVTRDLPALVSPLRPLAQQWDPLSPHACYMLILSGAIKVDLIFADQPHELELPWEVSAETILAIDRHFWDWILWLAPKHLAGKDELVSDELAKMSSHLLRPMGIESVPTTIESAVSLYLEARREQENRLGVDVSEELGSEVRQALRKHGYRI